jgi:hypothetical protein
MTTKPKSRRKLAARKSAAQDYAERAIYDGLTLCGSFAPTKNGFAAYDRKGKRLGVFATISNARAAITGDAEK